MKSFGSKPWMLPQPVHHEYVALGETVGKAFSDGKTLK
jgi:hypothetical protein